MQRDRLLVGLGLLEGHHRGAEAVVKDARGGVRHAVRRLGGVVKERNIMSICRRSAQVNRVVKEVAAHPRRRFGHASVANVKRSWEHKEVEFKCERHIRDVRVENGP
jgi:hypothetical protein